LKPGHADLKLAPGAWVDPAKAMEVVSKAAFKPKPEDVRVTAVGRVTSQGDTLLFTLEKMKQPTVLRLEAGKDEKSQALFSEMRQKAMPDVLVELEGFWTPAPKSAEAAPAAGETRLVGMLTVIRVAVPPSSARN
jgi:hypothetical protein